MTGPTRRPFGHIDIRVAGIPVSMDVDEALSISDVDSEMDKVSAQVGFWGDVWSSAQEEVTNADAHYRAWRATLTKQLLDEDPKLAEWKVKANIEAHPKFTMWKAAIAQAERNVILARALVDAFDGKRATLQSKGAKLRAEWEATGVHTPAHPKRRATRVRDEATDADIEMDETAAEDAPPSLAPPKAAHSTKRGKERVERMKGLFGKKTS